MGRVWPRHEHSGRPLSSIVRHFGIVTTRPVSPVQADLDEPILFRTTSETVYRSALSRGSIWLRSAQYFRDLEDISRSDRGEGINSGTTAIPLRISPENGSGLEITGPGHIGQEIVPH